MAIRDSLNAGIQQNVNTYHDNKKWGEMKEVQWNTSQNIQSNRKYEFDEDVLEPQ